jgi:TonB family protein
MICGSCRRRTDPNRSFCTNCGSSVFVDEGHEAGFSASPVSRSSSVSATPRALRDLQRSATSLDRTALATVRKSLKAARAAKAAAPSFTLGPLIRLAVFVGLVWYVWGWLAAIPEVVVLKDQLQAGHISDTDLQAAKDAVGARIQTFLRNAQDPNPPRAVESAEKSPAAPARRPAESPADAPARSAQPGAVASAPDTDSLPPGVSLPGDGVSMPRVVHQVNPEYTPEALRAKLEGTVLLQAVVRTHGVPTDISVLRSLDRRFGLDQRAIAALREWRFAPGLRAGQPVPVLVQVEMSFSLK